MLNTTAIFLMIIKVVKLSVSKRRNMMRGEPNARKSTNKGTIIFFTWTAFIRGLGIVKPFY
jgi:hypothetical protein